MKPTDEQVEAARKACPPFWRDTDQCEKHIAKMLRAAAGVKPRVKPLVWKDNGGGYLDAITVVGCYEIQRRGGGPYGFSLNGQYKREVFPTLDEAKAAAQADYEARILSALTKESD